MDLDFWDCFVSKNTLSYKQINTVGIFSEEATLLFLPPFSVAVNS